MIARSTLCPFYRSLLSVSAGARALRLLLLMLRSRGSLAIFANRRRSVPRTFLSLSWCAVCAVRCGTRVSSSRRGVPRYRGACAPTPPGITEVPPPRVPARARSFAREFIFGPIAIKRDSRKTLADASLDQSLSPVARTFRFFFFFFFSLENRKSLLREKAHI